MKLWIIIITLGGFTGSATAQSKKPDAKQVKVILATAEDIRSPSQAEISVKLSTVQADQKTAYDMKILRSTERRAHIEFLGPKEERGRKMLAHGNRYWSTFPSSRRVVSISRKEMIGNSAFALADVFQMDAEKDYKAKFVAFETLGEKSTIKLQLDARHQESPYFKVLYWVEKKDYYPMQAQFFGFSGNLLKTMTVGKRQQLAGRERPESLVMVDEIIKGRRSTWQTQKMRKYKFPDHIFTKDFLKKQ